MKNNSKAGKKGGIVMAGHEEHVPLMHTFSTPKTPIDARLSTYFAWALFFAFLAGVIFLTKIFA